MKEIFSHAATVFPVKNIEESISFYTNKLKFELTFEWGQPTSYAVLKSGSVQIHLSQRMDRHKPSKEHCALYIFVNDVEAIYHQCVSNQIKIKNVPGQRDYDMTDFDIIDPDGYIITFGKG